MEGLAERTNLENSGIVQERKEQAKRNLEFVKRLEYVFEYEKYRVDNKTVYLRRKKLKKGRGFILDQLKDEFKELKKKKVA